MRFLQVGAALIMSIAFNSCKTNESGAGLRSEVDMAAPGDDKVKITMDMLRADAADRCRGTWQKPVIAPVPVLDPPTSGGPEAVGLTFQEELAVTVKEFFGKDKFYLVGKPRIADNKLPVDLYLDPDNSGAYKKVRWESLDIDYTSEKITPPIGDCAAKGDFGARKECAKDAVPPAGRYLTELIFGHQTPMRTWPQFFDLRSNAYIRFSGYPPMVGGASFRLGAHRLWSIKEGETSQTEFNDQDFTSPEDFPVMRALYASVQDETHANAMVIVENELLCGALSLDMVVKDSPEITVDGYWYARRDFDWKKDANTGLAAYSSMFWMNESDTPGYSGDEAHDSDTMRVQFSDGSETIQPIVMPKAKLKVYHLDDPSGKKAVTGWSLGNEDRDTLHYRFFIASLGNSNFINRASYRVEVLDSNIKTGASLYVHWTDSEFLDNAVGVSTIREDIKKVTTPENYTHFKYRTTAYLEGLVWCAQLLDDSKDHFMKLDTWGSNFALMETEMNKDPIIQQFHRTKVALAVPPNGEPKYQCTNGEANIAYWDGTARINGEYYKIEKIIP